MKKKIAELSSKRGHRTLVIWAADCAEHVLPYFEDKYQKDNRRRKAIEACRVWVRGEICVGAARSAAFVVHAAARAAEGMVRAAARTAGHAVATVHVTTHAVHAANYSAIAATFAGADKERDW